MADRQQPDDDQPAGESTDGLPESVVEEAERLTRLARQSGSDAEAAAYRDRRERVVGRHDYVPRVRDEDDTLVCYPEEWVEDGTVQLDRLEDTDRAVEVSLSGPADPVNWQDVEEHNAALVAAVRERHGPDHAANARAFADFMGNHYAKRVEEATAAEREEFLTDYYPRNAFATDRQKSMVEESLRLLFEAADD